MKEKENEKKTVRITDGDSIEGVEMLKEEEISQKEKLKKPLIFALMAVVFAGCMYLIFKPASRSKQEQNIGLNDAVPQASEAGLESDKQKAYEQELLEQKMQEKRNALTSLSDYWNRPEDEQMQFPIENQQENYDYKNSSSRAGNAALNSYRDTRNTLSSFYEEPDYETQELRKELEQLKEQLAEKDIPAAVTVDDQLALMEKSYQMAAKYLPSSNTLQPEQTEAGISASKSVQKQQFAAVAPVRKNVVSALYREPTDSAFLSDWNQSRNRGFYTAGTNEQKVQPKNSIRAIVEQTQVVSVDSDVKIRLLEPAHTPEIMLPKGTTLMAKAKFENNRLQLKVTSIERDGYFVPVDLTVYGLDGQQGLGVPYSPEMNALTEIAANMSQTSGTSLMMTRSAGQQIAGDLSRGAVQGISGYFSKKVRTPKITVKAGQQLFLVSKN